MSHLVRVAAAGVNNLFLWNQLWPSLQIIRLLSNDNQYTKYNKRIKKNSNKIYAKRYPNHKKISCSDTLSYTNKKKNWNRMICNLFLMYADLMYANFFYFDLPIDRIRRIYVNVFVYMFLWLTNGCTASCLKHKFIVFSNNYFAVLTESSVL